MKKMIVLFALFVLFSSSPSFAQNLKSEVNESIATLDGTIEGLKTLVTKVQKMRKSGTKEIDEMQAKIDAQRIVLKERRKEIEKRNREEPHMNLEDWKKRVAVREQLVKEEDVLQYSQQILDLEKSNFEHKIYQIEQHIIATFAKQIAMFNELYGENIKQYVDDLD